MEIVKDNDVIHVKDFFSGSEMGIVSYEQKKKDLSSINIKETYQKSSPISVLVSSTENKLKKILLNVFPDTTPSVSNAFEIVYNTVECPDNKIDFGSSDYVAIIAITRPVQVGTLQGDVMIDLGSLLIAQRDGIAIKRDDDDGVSLISIAHINVN